MDLMKWDVRLWTWFICLGRKQWQIVINLYIYIYILNIIHFFHQLQWPSSSFAVTIESVGALPPDVLFIEAVKVLKLKCRTFLDELNRTWHHVQERRKKFWEGLREEMTLHNSVTNVCIFRRMCKINSFHYPMVHKYFSFNFVNFFCVVFWFI